MRGAALALVLFGSALDAACFDVVRCSSDDKCPEAEPFCVAGTCATSRGEGERGEGEGVAGEGEGAAGEGEGAAGEGEGTAGEGEGTAGEGEGASSDCRVSGCAADLGCVDEGSVDLGTCVPPPNTPSSCNDVDQFFARADQAPWVWRPTFVDATNPPASASFGCGSTERAVRFKFDFLDDENDAGHSDDEVTCGGPGGFTTPPPSNVATQFTGTDGHIGVVTATICFDPSVTSFAFIMNDDQGHASNPVCIAAP